MVGDGVATSVVDAVDPMLDAPAERKRMACMYLADCQFSGLAQPQKRPDQNAARLRALSEHKANERFNWIDEEVDLASFSTFCHSST